MFPVQSKSGINDSNSVLGSKTTYTLHSDILSYETAKIRFTWSSHNT